MAAPTQPANGASRRRLALVEARVAQAHEYMARLERSLAKDVLTPGIGMIYGEQAKYVTWTIPAELGNGVIFLLQMTDLQFGHVMCRYDRVVEYRDWVLAAPNRFMLWTGDMLDAWAMHSPGTPWEQISNPQSQVYRMVEMWAPARHRIIGYVGGNHERRPEPAFGDLGTLVATLLRIPYSAGRQFVDVRFGQHDPFRISLWHGAGGARTKGTVAQVLDRFCQQGDSQLYCMGHLHQPMIMPGWKEYRDSRHRQIKLRKYVGCVGSSFLESWNTYGEIRGFASTDVLMPCCQLEADGHWQVNLRTWLLPLLVPMATMTTLILSWI